eukprot:gnl/TRDRNA2_/TRDRNA2_200374_c0_seq1.p1 gnl/TRDRNA2_/TRDRNA2_200374_c0~~gnl/TRDRNA2_/TRDRNA2_200374_c0_seq1.p1  ORF type:complete len:770 (+),score=171.24 gnl/TRDRNA2_/TRDRNA2_200374_c0_seq1:50-2311(+)
MATRLQNLGPSSLHIAAKTGKLQAVKHFLEELGCAVDATAAKGATALMLAAQNGHIEVVRYLAAERGASVNSAASNGATALILAAQNGHLRVVKFLAGKCGADVDTAAASGDTALVSAAQNGHFKVVQYLVECGAAIDAAAANGDTAFLSAAQNGHLEIARYLCEKGAAIDEAAADGATALMVAAQNGHLEIVQFLSGERNASVDLTMADGATALMLTAQHGHLEVARYLCEERHASVNAAMDNGGTALMLAALHGHLEVVQYLASEKAANVDAAMADGATAVMLAALHGHLDVVRYLADERGAAVDTADAAAAAREGHLEVQRFICELAEARAAAHAEELLAELDAASSSGPASTSGVASKSSKARKRKKASSGGKSPKESVANGVDTVEATIVEMSNVDKLDRQQLLDPTLENLRRSMEQRAKALAKGHRHQSESQGEPSEGQSVQATEEAEEESVMQPDVEALQHVIDEQAVQLDRLSFLLASKETECAELLKQNEALFEELTELRSNYAMVSEFYDEAVERRGAVERELKSDRKKIAAQQRPQVSEIYPALAAAEEWLRGHQDPIPIMQRLEIPVLCLRWTHDCINRKMMFGHDGHDNDSIFKLVDQLQRGEKAPTDINRQLDVVQYDGSFCCLSNRRLTALMMHQSLHRDRTVKAWCRVCSSDSEKFREMHSTTNDGLGIETREGQSQHFGAPLFKRGEYVLHELDRLVQRHQNEIELPETLFLAKLRTRPSTREADGCSLTLSHGSK